MDKLRPCPKCGGNNLIRMPVKIPRSSQQWWVIACEDCGFHSQYAGITVNAAESGWNNTPEHFNDA